MTKSDPVVKLFDKVVRFREVVTLTSQKNRNGTTSWYANIGYDAKGRTVRRGLGLNQDDAYAKLREINQRIAQGKLTEAANLFEVSSDLEVKAVLRKLEGHGVSLMQAVDFFLKHHRPTAGHLTVRDAVTLFLEDLEKRGRAQKYIKAYRETYFPHFCKSFGNHRLVDIGLGHAETYIYETKSKLSRKSKADHITKLTTFFNAMADLKYYQKDLNPFAQMKKPQASKLDEQLEEKDRCVSVAGVEAMLKHLVSKEYWDLLALLTADLFCGIRVEESRLLNWNTINLDRGVLDLSGKNAKKRRRRATDIPPNALHWFLLARNGQNGKWNVRTENALRILWRRTKQKVIADNKQIPNLVYHQNWARATFVSYGYRHFGHDKTLEMIGHTMKGDVLRSNYREVVSDEDARAYFEIVPDDIKRLQIEEHNAQMKEEYPNLALETDGDGRFLEPVWD